MTSSSEQSPIDLQRGGTPALFDQFDLIRVINLRHRADRRAEVLGELRRLGLADDPKLRFFDAIAPAEPGTFTSKGARGVFMSQLAILTEAAELDRSVLILEDDVDFTQAVWTAAMPAGWDVFYGGYQASNPDDLDTSDIIGAHCMGFTPITARRLVPYLERLLERPDHPPIDGAYVWFRRSHPELSTVFAVPPIAEQRPSRTDIATPNWFDRTPGVRETAGLVRRVKRLLRRNVRWRRGGH